MKIISIWIAIALLAGSLIFLSFRPNVLSSESIPQKPISLYERVLKAGKIRAAYTIYPPGCFKNEKGELKGVFIETLEQAAKNLNLTVEWTEEVGWATQIEGLDRDRYDMIGSSVWTNPKRARLATLSAPLYFSPLYICA